MYVMFLANLSDISESAIGRSLNVFDSINLFEENKLMVCILVNCIPLIFDDCPIKHN